MVSMLALSMVDDDPPLKKPCVLWILILVIQIIKHNIGIYVFYNIGQFVAVLILVLIAISN
jgi:hypothetical protein